MTLQVLIPIHTYPQQTPRDIVSAVACVARHLQADIHALVHCVAFPRVSSPFGKFLIDIPALIHEAKERSRAEGAEIIRALEQEIASIGRSFRSTEIECPVETFHEAVKLHGRYHDFCIIGLHSGNWELRATAEAVIFGCGRPAVLLPDHPTANFDHVMIAWDGSRVATRAVADSWPFLRRAQTITVASVIDEKPLPDDDPANRLAQYLSHHDMRSNVVYLERRESAIADALQSRARQSGAGMIVMGAFGHSRVRDFVLGGATNGVLGDLRIPILLSH